MVGSRSSLPSWIGAAATRVDIEGNVSSMSESMFRENGEESASPEQYAKALSDGDLGFGQRAFSAAGAAFISAIIVNPLDVAKIIHFSETVFIIVVGYVFIKTRLQAQAAGVSYHGLCRMAPFETMLSDIRCYPPCTRAALSDVPVCPPDCFQYRGTLDVFSKVIRQEGFMRLWRGTGASLALAVPTVGIYLPCYDVFRNIMEEFTTQNVPSLTPYVPLVAGSLARSLACITCYPVELARTRMQAFKVTQSGTKPPGVWKTLHGVITPVRNSNNIQNLQSYRVLWTGLGAQLARDVPFSAICWSTLEPIRRRIISLIGDEATAASVLGANFSAGFVAGSLAAAATCPLDVAKTRRQIEKDPARAWKMTTRQTLLEIWRDGGMRGLFTGVGPRVGRAGPSVGIVVSFYEVVKYALHHRQQLNNGTG